MRCLVKLLLLSAFLLLSTNRYTFLFSPLQLFKLSDYVVNVYFLMEGTVHLRALRPRDLLGSFGCRLFLFAVVLVNLRGPLVALVALESLQLFHLALELLGFALFLLELTLKISALVFALVHVEVRAFVVKL